jgi:hypothetical protein
MVYYAMPLIMKSENGTSQHQQLCLNPNQAIVSESNYTGQLSTPQPQQAQLINLSNNDVNGSSPSQQNNYTYQLLTSNDHQQLPQHQNSHASTSIQRAQKQTKSFQCEHCNMMFTTKSAHTSHIKSHAKQQATTQNSASPSSISGTQQMQSSDPYQCDVCKKTFAVPARLVS